MARRRGGGRWTVGSDANQLTIEWNAPSTPRTGEPQSGGAAATDPAGIPQGPPALRLRWDFKTRFPEPTEAALDAGLIDPEDAGPASVQAIHAAHAAELLGALRDADADVAARRTAVARLDGEAPALPPSSCRQSRLQRWYANVLGVYADLFGPESAEAFDQAVRAWHARVEVVVDHDQPRPNAGPLAGPLEPERVATVRALPASVDAAAGAMVPVTARVVARLPVPRPLPHAVAAGRFGHEEDGCPVSPRPDEVRVITEVHAEHLADLVAQLNVADQPGAGPAEVAQRVAVLHDAVRQYAEDFGDAAAERLLAYARRTARQREAPTTGRGR